ncbi:MAG: PQQ-binding-like beta-propeller repeat protein [Planctomycetota bacterium]|nr:PQQ-binding-like beta-propeller repeat protein [Planctomycetota bacterium]MDA1214443.1 PQQ-binding-like beta-propeller repeat protein [Planctomycetota bacterium]
MRDSHRRFVLLVAFCLFAMVLQFLTASAQAGIVSGEIKTIAADKNVIVIEAGKAKVSKTLRISNRASITLNSKTVELNEILPGTKVSLFTDKSGTVTKIIARSASTDDSENKDAAESKPVSRKATRKSRSRDDDDDESISDAEWHQFRGPKRDGHSLETGLLAEWPNDGPALVYEVGGLGEGYSSISVSDGVIYTMGTVNDGDQCVIALNAEDGELLWSVKTGPAYQNGAGNGPRCTPTVDGNDVYAVDANGELICLDKKSGDIRWQKNILKDFQGNNIGWGICESILIDDDKLICTPGGKAATMIALEKSSGNTIWRSDVPTNPSASYASAIVADVGGVRQYINFTHAGLVGVRAEDGSPLWGNQSSSNGTANCSAPLYDDGFVFSSSGYGTGGAAVQLRSSNGLTAAELKYHTNDMANHHGGMVVVDGYVYGTHDPGILTCLDLKTGNVKWKDRSVGKGSVIYADGKIYLRSEGGPLSLVDANPQKYVEHGRFDQPNRSNRPAWAYPAINGGRLYLRDLDKLLVYDIAGE